MLSPTKYTLLLVEKNKNVGVILNSPFSLIHHIHSNYHIL